MNVCVGEGGEDESKGRGEAGQQASGDEKDSGREEGKRGGETKRKGDEDIGESRLYKEKWSLAFFFFFLI